MANLHLVPHAPRRHREPTRQDPSPVARPHRFHARLATLGGVLFIASDSLLAPDKFALPLPLASWWILLTYWLAQWGIAWALRAR